MTSTNRAGGLAEKLNFRVARAKPGGLARGTVGTERVLSAGSSDN
jgi:hypothetical protein